MSVQISAQILDKKAYVALVRLRRELGIPTNVTIRNVLFVAKDGNDASAQPGSLTYKYLTIQAAVNAAAAMAPGSLVWVGPGAYFESVSVPDGTTNLVIAGQDKLSTVIQPPPDQPAIAVVPTVPIGFLGIANMVMLSANNAAPTLLVDGTATAASIFSAGALSVRDVLVSNTGLSASISIRAASNVELERVRAEFPLATGPGSFATQLRECSGYAVDSNLNHTLIDWDGAQVRPVSNVFRLTSCNGSLVVDKLAHVALKDGNYQGNQSLGIDALVLQATDASNLPNPPTVGRVTADGTNFGYTARLHATYNNVTSPPTFDQSVLTNCNLALNVEVRSFGTVRHGPRILGSVIARTIDVGGGSDLDIRDTEFEQGGLLASGDGTVDRSTVRLPGCILQPGPGFSPIQPAPNLIGTLGGAPLPAYAITYGVLVEPRMTDAPASWNIGAKTGTDILGQGFISNVPDAVLADIILVRR